MCEEKVRQWRRNFKNGRTNVHDEEQSGRPSAYTDEIFQQGGQELRCDRRNALIVFYKLLQCLNKKIEQNEP